MRPAHRDSAARRQPLLFHWPIDVAGTTYPVAVGAGGAGGAGQCGPTDGNAGSGLAGGDTSFGSPALVEMQSGFGGFPVMRTSPRAAPSAPAATVARAAVSAALERRFRSKRAVAGRARWPATRPPKPAEAAQAFGFFPPSIGFGGNGGDGGNSTQLGPAAGCIRGQDGGKGGDGGIVILPGVG